MKKKFIKCVSLMLSLALLITCVAGCGKEKTISTNTGTGEYPEKLTIFAKIGANALKAGAQDRNDTLPFKMIEKATGCHVEWINPSPTAFGEQFNLLLASGKYPDIIQSSWGGKTADLKLLIEDGVILPIQDYLEHMPNLSKFIEENPEIRRQILSSDGKLIYAPGLRLDEELKIFVGPEIRYDWLEKLGLEVPKTLDEFYNVLMAFKTGDPNGNGEADEIPFTGIGADSSTSWAIGNIAWAFNTHYGFYIKDGKVTHGMLENEMKDALKYINKLYMDGLIDQDFLINDRDKIDNKILNDKAGFAFGVQPSLYAASMDDGVRKFAAIPYINGICLNPTYRSNLVNNECVITSACSNPSGAAKWLDFFYGEEGIEYTNFGEEGVSFEKVDGKNQFIDSYISNNPNGKGQIEMIALATLLTTTDFAMLQTWEGYSQTLLPWGKESIEMWTDTAEYSNALPPLMFTEEESKEISRLYPDMKTYISEIFCNMIIGRTDISEFDNIRNQLEKMNISRVIEIYNQAYERYMNN